MNGLFRSGSLEFAVAKDSLIVLDLRTFAGCCSFKQCLSAGVLLNPGRHFWSQIKIQTTIKTQKRVNGPVGDKLATSRLFAVFVS
jgi:hypothetical protein